MKYIIFFLFFSSQLFAKDWMDTFKIPTNFGDYKFEIIFDQKDESFATIVKSILINKTETLADYFQYAPQDIIHIVIQSDPVTANGSAQSIPANIINLYNYPPTHSDSLNGSHNWEEILTVHELVHIIHMDQTRSFLKYMRYIFGSIGKLGGVVPRWFTEGVATWAESEFTETGRLKDPLIKYHVTQKLKDVNFCQEIDCLDEPGQYPYGHTPYWVGAHFLSYLETQKPGTIRCLIERNSETIPFNLGRAFVLCTNKEIEDNFYSFRNQIQSLKRSLPLKTALHKGIHIYDNKMLTLDFIDDDLTLKIGDQSLHPPYRIDNVQVHEDSLLVSTLPNPEERIWYEYNQDFIEIPGIKPKTAYLFKYQKQFLEIYYENDQWLLKYDQQSLPLAKTIRYPHLFKDKLFYESNKAIYVFNLKTLKTKKIYQSKLPFQVLTYCEGEPLLRNKEGILFPGKILSNNEILLAANSKNDLYLFTRVKKIKTTCQGLRKRMKEKNSASDQATRIKTPVKKESYPSFAHFLPHYWFFTYVGGGADLERWSIFTTLSDPAKNSEVSLKYDLYPEISKNAVNFTISHHWDDFTLVAKRVKEYSKSSLSAEPNSDESIGALAALNSTSRDMLTQSSFIILQKKNKDFLNPQVKKGMTFSYQFSFLKTQQYKNDFLNSYQLLLIPSYKNQDTFKDYFSLESQVQLKLKPSSIFGINLRSNYGRMFKKGFSDGVLFGGGEGSIASESFYRFLAIPYSDTFGNEIWTSTIEFSLESLDIYSAGGGLFPIYLKKMDTLIGFEHLKADRTYLNNQFVHREDILGSYVGARFDSTIFYLAPITMELVYAWILNQDVKNEQFRFLVKSTFEF